MMDAVGMIHPVHQRLAELWQVNLKRPLTKPELSEMNQCLSVNGRLCFKNAYLENCSLLASMTNDIDWQHEICLDIEMLQYPETKKKPGHKGTD